MARTSRIRSFVRPVALLALLVSAASVPLRAEQPTITPREIWPQLISASERGDHKDRDAKLADLLLAGRNSGIQRFPLFARSASAIARRAQKGKNPEDANWAIEAASKLDPRSPDIDFTAADIAAARGNWVEVARSLGSGVVKVMTHRQTAGLARSNLAIVFALALAGFAIVFAIVLFVRYSRVGTHDLRETLGDRFGPGVATVLAFALLFLPVFLWLGPLWLVLYWIAIFFGYALPREKTIAIVLLVSLALVPVLLEWTAFRISSNDSPILHAATASRDHSYDPEALVRLREVIQAIPDQAKLFLLLGNLEFEQGDEQGASVHYRKALELDEHLGGAHLNLGNLHFLVNDLQAATLEYQKAEDADPSMAIADYNRSVASGEMYKFDEQGTELEQAKQKDRSLIESIIAEPPPQKVVMYQLPISAASNLFEQLVQRKEAHDVFGNFATFSPLKSLENPLTTGSVLAMILAFALWMAARRNGLAGECIKCGRTFCHRCKSTKESATYCTQCIHIYLKRDGVSLDTKRAKLAEVQEHQNGTAWKRKIMTTFFPGSGQMLSDATIRGLVILFLFLFFVSIALLCGALAPLGDPAEMMKEVLRIAAIIAAVVIWLFASIPVYRQAAAT